MLNWENYLALLSLAKDDADLCEIIVDAVKACTGYVSAVCESEAQIKIARLTLSGADLRERVTDWDQRRHNAHEAAILSTKILNRVAEQKGVGPVFTGDPSKRLEVADFCLALTTRIFEERTL